MIKQQTMEDLLRSEDVKLASLKRGDKVNATILKIGKREILANIGAKSYGIITGREFEVMGDMKHMLKEGDVVPAEVVIPEMEDGETLISVRRTLMTKLWDDLIDAQKNRKEVEVMALRSISAGLLVDCRSLRGFIPQQQLDPSNQDNPDKLVGHRLKVVVLEVDRPQNRLVLSQKEVTQKDELAAKRSVLSEFKKGETVSGSVSAVTSYTLIVQVVKGKKHAEGAVHISEVSWERVEDLSTLYATGDTIKAEISDIDVQEGMLILSIKKLLPDPWTDIEKKYPLEKQMTGTVVKITKLGVFIELDKGIEGLIHISKLPAGKTFSEGDKIPVTIDKIDADHRKISLAYVSVTKPIGYR